MREKGMPLKFKEPHVIRATYRIVTPMFIGDAEQKASGISPASVKGALRFWWRALRWGQIRAQIQSDTAALQRLHREEAELFGTAVDTSDEKRKSGVAKFTLRATSSGKPASLPNPAPGIQYLLCQGLYKHGHGYLRPALKAGEKLEIVLITSPTTTKEEQQQLVQTLMALGVLGGLGSRARKGFGSLAIESLQDGNTAIPIPTDIVTLKRLITTWGVTSGLPPFTAFSNKTRLDISLQGTDPLAVLDKAGQEQQLYRSYGRADHTGIHKVAGQVAEQNFKIDHALVFDAITRKTANKVPQRTVFGLPHNYFFSSLAAPNNKADFSPATQERSRRASPLIIHVHQFPNNQVALIQMLFPATFLPEGDTLEFKMGNRPNEKVNVRFNENQMIDWQVIHKYMDRFAGKERIL